MPIPIDDQPQAFPSLKLRNVGDYAIVRLVHRYARPKTNFVTGEVELNDKGKPRQELVFTGLFMGGTAVVPVGTQEEPKDGQPPVGGAVRLYISGHRWGSLIEAEKAYGTVPNVGDVYRITYTGSAKSSMRGGADKKVWTFKLRPSDPDRDAIEVERAEGMHRAIKAAGPSPTTATHHEPEAALEDPSAVTPYDDVPF